MDKRAAWLYKHARSWAYVHVQAAVKGEDERGQEWLILLFHQSTSGVMVDMHECMAVTHEAIPPLVFHRGRNQSIDRFINELVGLCWRWGARQRRRTLL